MASKLRYELVAAVGEYKDSEGNTKKRFVRCGVVLEGDKGLSLKQDTVPVGASWDGWFMLREPRPKGDSASSGVRSPARGRSPSTDDDDPF